MSTQCFIELHKYKFKYIFLDINTSFYWIMSTREQWADLIADGFPGLFRLWISMLVYSSKRHHYHVKFHSLWCNPQGHLPHSKLSRWSLQHRGGITMFKYKKSLNISKGLKKIKSRKSKDRQCNGQKKIRQTII